MEALLPWDWARSFKQREKAIQVRERQERAKVKWIWKSDKRSNHENLYNVARAKEIFWWE